MEEIKDIPHGSVAIFSAHGVSPAVRAEADARDLRVVDATCPLVTKVHVYVKQKAEQGYQIVLIGHKDHGERESLRQCFAITLRPRWKLRSGIHISQVEAGERPAGELPLPCTGQWLSDPAR